MSMNFDFTPEQKLIRDSIRDPEKTPQIPAVIAQGQSQYGMQTFALSLLDLYRDGMISYETAREAASNPDDFDLKVRGIFSAAEMTYETTGKGDDKGSKRESPKPSPSPFFKR